MLQNGSIISTGQVINPRIYFDLTPFSLNGALVMHMLVDNHKLFFICIWSTILGLFLAIAIATNPLINSTSNSSAFAAQPSQNIPIVVPFETNHRLDPVIDEEPINQEVEHVMSDSQIRSQESKDSASIFATCEQLPVSTVTANGNDGNIPSNVLDNNLNTRWSNLGQGSWIQLDLGSKKSIWQRRYCLVSR